MKILTSHIRTIFQSLSIATLLTLTTHLEAQIFTDNFNSGASASWGNEVGTWSAAGGVYTATTPSNFPNAFSSLPFTLTDFSINVDVLAVADGGIWLRSSAAPGTNTGITGVLLVTGGAVPTGLYWHVVTDGNTYGSILNSASGLFTAGANPTIRVEVIGNIYSAFVNGSLTPATTLNTATFASGRIALYDNSSSGQSFDNVSVVPEPSSALLLLSGVLVVLRCRSLRTKHREA